MFNFSLDETIREPVREAPVTRAGSARCSLPIPEHPASGLNMMTSAEQKMNSNPSDEGKQEPDVLHSYRQRLDAGYYLSSEVIPFVARCLAAEFTPLPARPCSPLGETPSE